MDRQVTAYVYVADNPAMPGYVKIGTTENLEGRMRTLSNTSVPLPFILRHAQEVDDIWQARQVERRAFRELAHCRVKGREFVQCKVIYAQGAVVRAHHATLPGAFREGHGYRKRAGGEWGVVDVQH